MESSAFLDSPSGWEEQLLSVLLNCPGAEAACRRSIPARSVSTARTGLAPLAKGWALARLSSPAWSSPTALAPGRSALPPPWSLLVSEGKVSEPDQALVREFLARHGVRLALRSRHGRRRSGMRSGRASPQEAFRDWQRCSSVPSGVCEREPAKISGHLPGRRALPGLRGVSAECACPAVRLEGRSLALVSSQPISDLIPFFRSLSIEPGLEKVVSPPVAEIVGRLECLVEVGLDYLTLDRGSDTLSGGELQRARLAAQLGSGLVGVCTILDEPTAGLHPRDTARLISPPATAADQGNSVLVVEHDLAMIQAADWVLDLGPGAGPLGGSVVADRSARAIGAFKDSITGSILGAGRSSRRIRARCWRNPGLDRDSRRVAS